MNRQGSERPFDDLLERLCIEELAEGEWQELAAKIADGDGALRSYIEAAQWRQSIGHLVGGESSPGSAVLGLLDERGVDEAGSHSASPMPHPSIRPRGAQPDLRFIYDACFGRGRLPLAPPFSRAQASQQWSCTGLPNSPCTTSRKHNDKPQLVLAPQTPFVQESQLGKVSGLSLEASSDGLLRSLQVGQELRSRGRSLSSGHMRSRSFPGPTDH